MASAMVLDQAREEAEEHIWDRIAEIDGHTYGDDDPALWTIQVAIMLKAMAIECLIKAVWVASGREIASEGKIQRLPDAGWHELHQMGEKLTQEGLIRLKEEETHLLHRLARWIPAGRYPVFKKDGVTVPRLRNKDGTPTQVTGLSWGTKDEPVFRSIVGKLVVSYVRHDSDNLMPPLLANILHLRLLYLDP